MKSDKLFYSMVEAGEILGGLSKHTIARDVRSGRIAAKRYGRRILIASVELERIAKTLPNVGVAGAR